jgi:DinB family protein
MNTTTEHTALRETMDRMDDAWAAFRERIHSLPSEQLERPVGGGGWTRKQMLAHIGTWHDLAIERLARYVESGEPIEVSDDEDAINARAARAAAGRPMGEVLLQMEDSYRRLRREIARLSDAQLAAHDDWAAAIIAANTYGHYADHLDDLEARPA